MKEREFVLLLLHDFVKSAECFRETYQHLRKRRDCPATEKFFKGIAIQDHALAKGFAYVAKGIDDEMHKNPKG